MILNLYTPHETNQFGLKNCFVSVTTQQIIITLKICMIQPYVQLNIEVRAMLGNKLINYSELIPWHTSFEIIRVTGRIRSNVDCLTNLKGININHCKIHMQRFPLMKGGTQKSQSLG